MYIKGRDLSTKPALFYYDSQNSNSSISKFAITCAAAQ
jgi:hypothetical protein